ncbi:hypothetical protein [Salmonella sp. s54836]|uniref:hypothetical protein n=1 Tax=Salmonella sp. s54836 TaxID=3159673 RepID=UPI003980EAC5
MASILKNPEKPDEDSLNPVKNYVGTSTQININDAGNEFETDSGPQKKKSKPPKAQGDKHANANEQGADAS